MPAMRAPLPPGEPRRRPRAAQGAVATWHGLEVTAAEPYCELFATSTSRRLACGDRSPPRAAAQHDWNAAGGHADGSSPPRNDSGDRRQKHGDGTVNATSPLPERRRPTDPAPGRRPTQEVAVVNTGDTAWILTSAALVLLMTPGLALFYGGMVRAKSVLNMMMMSFGALALISVLWVLYGYSMPFGNDVGGGLARQPGRVLRPQGPDGGHHQRGRRPARPWPSSASRRSSRSSPSR